MNSDEIPQEVTHYRVYRIRWIQLIVYVLGTFANAIISMTFAPIETETATFYNITTTQVNSLAIIFLFLYPFGTILSIWLSKTLSMRMIICIGSVLNMGVFIRLLSLIKQINPFISLIIGQLFPGIGAPFFLNSITLFASRWFSPSQRDIATSICSMANPLGLAIGSLIPSLIIQSNPTVNEFFILLLIESLFTLITTMLILIIFRSEPETPPSPSEEHHQSIHFKEDFMNLIKNRHYLILLIGFSLGLALFNGITALLEQLITPQGYTSEDAGLFGAIIIVAGLLNSFFVGLIMDKTHAYRLILKILLIGASGSAILFLLMLQPNKLYPLAVSIGLMGFFLLPLLPVSFECALESTYPIRPEWSTGLLMCSGNIIGGLFTYLIGFLIKLSSKHLYRPSNLFIFCFFIISAITLFFYQGPYLRLEAEKKSTEKSSYDNSSI